MPSSTRQKHPHKRPAHHVSTKGAPNHQLTPQPKAGAPTSGNQQDSLLRRIPIMDQMLALAQRLAHLESTNGVADHEMTPQRKAGPQTTGNQQGSLLRRIPIIGRILLVFSKPHTRVAPQNVSSQQRSLLRQIPIIDSILLVFSAAVVIAFTWYRDYIESVEPRTLFPYIVGICLCCALILWFKRPVSIELMFVGLQGVLL